MAAKVRLFLFCFLMTLDSGVGSVKLLICATAASQTTLENQLCGLVWLQWRRELSSVSPFRVPLDSVVAPVDSSLRFQWHISAVSTVVSTLRRDFLS